MFLAGMGKKFNKQDVRGRLLIDMDLGIGTDHLDLEQRTQNSTLKKNVMKRKMDLDNLGEELRVLYVAMTRAKEKLIMTGTDRFHGNLFHIKKLRILRCCHQYPVQISPGCSQHRI